MNERHNYNTNLSRPYSSPDRSGKDGTAVAFYNCYLPVPDLQRIAGYAGVEGAEWSLLLIITILLIPLYVFIYSTLPFNTICFIYCFFFILLLLLPPLPIAFAKIASEVQKATQNQKKAEWLLLLIITLLFCYLFIISIPYFCYFLFFIYYLFSPLLPLTLLIILFIYFFLFYYSSSFLLFYDFFNPTTFLLFYYFLFHSMKIAPFSNLPQPSFNDQ